QLLQELETPSRWDVVIRLAPPSVSVLDGAALDEALHAVADFADLKSPYLVGHSSGVASLARAASDAMRLPDADATAVERAGLIHDLGRVSVSAAVWGKRTTLSAGDWEAIRLHPYQTERILHRSALAPLASLASAHHEPVDGSGYFRGSKLRELPPAARVLATADLYHAMIEPRPQRAGLS